MIEGPLAVIGEFVVSLVIALVEISVVVVVASARPWHYLLSPTFRERTNQKYAQRYLVTKMAYLLWGSVVLLSSIFVMATIGWFFLSATEPKRPSSTAATSEVIRRLEEVFNNNGLDQ